MQSTSSRMFNSCHRVHYVGNHFIPFVYIYIFGLFFFFLVQVQAFLSPVEETVTSTISMSKTELRGNENEGLLHTPTNSLVPYAGDLLLWK